MVRRFLLVFVLGLLVSGVPLAAQSHVLNRQIWSLENDIGLRDQELAALQEQIDSLNETLASLQEEINALNETGETGEGPGGLPFNFTFTWGPDTQKVVPGTLRIEISLRWGTFHSYEYLYCIVKINDNEYNDWDYLGIVFDKNNNSVIDLGGADDPLGVWACNMTAPSVLGENGFLGFAEVPPEKCYACTFDPNIGYTFRWLFGKDELHLPINSNTPVHLCFHDHDAPYPAKGVFIRFTFFNQGAP